MAKKSNQKIKLLYLMKILLENTDDEHGMTLAEISDALGEYGIDAERKTLYDDIDVLCLFGLDIEKRKGKSVTYHVISREFELPELKLLVDAVQSSRFITHKKSNELIKKIEGFASRYEAQELQRQVFVSNRIKAMNESILRRRLHTRRDKPRREDSVSIFHLGRAQAEEAAPRRQNISHQPVGADLG